MPKKFNELEKARIEHKLMECARELFIRYGIKKTSVEDLAKGAGIATGSFYSFYQSKEELFFDLLEAEEAQIRSVLMKQALNRPLNKESFTLFLMDSFKLISENPIIQQILLSESFEALIRKLPSERLERNFNQDQDMLYPFIQKWQTAGLLRTKSPELIISMIRSLILLSLHKREIGDSVYEDTIQLIISALAEGLFSEEERMNR